MRRISHIAIAGKRFRACYEFLNDLDETSTKLLLQLFLLVQYSVIDQTMLDCGWGYTPHVIPSSRRSPPHGYYIHENVFEVLAQILSPHLLDIRHMRLSFSSSPTITLLNTLKVIGGARGQTVNWNGGGMRGDWDFRLFKREFNDCALLEIDHDEWMFQELINVSFF